MYFEYHKTALCNQLVWSNVLSFDIFILQAMQSVNIYCKLIIFEGTILCDKNIIVAGKW